ncbi:MAG: DUF423 domain-containing protein [Xanthomonadales bacterium]|nr:DUF423 domain-containing protein [Xanthomonadales bacterium]
MRSRLSRSAILIAACAGVLAVMLGAFGAHALRAQLDEAALATWRTAVDYQFWHALALLAVGLLAKDRGGRALVVAAVAFVIGMLLFCGSLYMLALGAPRGLGAVTPVGGAAFIIGWAALGVAALRR